MELVRLRSVEDLAAEADRWNALWQASEASSPAVRAESLAAWLAEFAPGAECDLLVAVDAGRWAAALPLVRRRVKALCSATCLPYCSWWNSGELLLDAHADEAAALETLAQAIARQRQPLAWLDAIRCQTPRWQAFLGAVQRAGLRWVLQPQAFVGLVEIDHDWDDYRSRWSRSHRRQMKVAAKRAELAGGVELRICDAPGEDLETLVRCGFEIEHRGWKGAAHSSVLSQPGMLDFYCEQAKLLAASGHAKLVFLVHGGEPIAFEFGLAAKGTYFSYKVGYDERFAAWTPGQLLRMKLLECFHADPACDRFDFAGALTGATARWSTRTEPVGRLVIGACSPSGSAWSTAYRLWTHRGGLFRAAPQPAAPEIGVRSDSLLAARSP